MAQYYKYNFVSPTPIFAIVKEELKSYFDTGMVDDLLFPIYLNKCLRHLSRATLPIEEVPLFVEDFEARLPDNFHAAREVWMCVESPLTPYQTASSFYSQSSTCTVQISPIIVNGNPCDGSCDDALCPECNAEEDVIEGVYKTNAEITRSFRQVYLLKPGNISTSRRCSVDYNKNWTSYGQTPGSNQLDAFDIRGNKLVTNFRTGTLHLVFYADGYNKNADQLVPDNYYIQEYVEKYLKHKIFEIISNQVNDETFKQIQQKVQYWDQQKAEAYILASIEVKKQTIFKKIQRINKDRRRLNKYERITANRRDFNMRYRRNN